MAFMSFESVINDSDMISSAHVIYAQTGEGEVVSVVLTRVRIRCKYLHHRSVVVPGKSNDLSYPRCTYSRISELSREKLLGIGMRVISNIGHVRTNCINHCASGIDLGKYTLS